MSLWSVFPQELVEDVGYILACNTSVSVERSGELGDDSWYLDPAEEDSLLSLELDVLGPPHKSGQVSSWLNIIPHSEVLWLLLE